MSLPLSISAIGDSHTLAYPFLEQVEAVDTVAVEVAGVSATRTYTAQFRWSTDGTTWSAWLTYNTATASAIVLNANNRFYREVRIARTGSDNTGVLTWTLDVMTLTRNPNAFVGHGALTDIGLQGELFDLFKAMILHEMPKTDNDAAQFQCIDTWPQKQSRAGGLRPIYLHEFRKTGEASLNSGSIKSDDNWSFSIAVKTIGESQGPTVEGVSMYKNALGKIRRMFSNRSYAERRYSFTFKNVNFTDIGVSRFGLHDFNITDRGIGIADNDQYQIFVVTFTIDISKLLYGYATV